MPDKLDPKQFEQMAQDLTVKCENNESVSDALNQIPFEQRLGLARRMDEINEGHRKLNEDLPDLELTVEADGGGREHLTDMQSTTKDAYLWFIDSSKDTYDLPETARTNMFDYVVDTRLTRDTDDSKHLSEGAEYYEGAGKR
jgi:hypothetical protein